MKLRELVTFLDSYLDINGVQDISLNGLQFEGKEEVHKIAYAVDAGVDVFKKAIDSSADMLVVHHGQFWTTNNPVLVGWNKKRIDILYQGNLSLYAAHLPLDKHKEVGNNAQLLRLLNVEPEHEFGLISGKAISWYGRLPVAQPREDVVVKLNKKLGVRSTALLFGPQVVHTVAVCTGAGGYARFFEAQKLGVDMYITGEATEVYQVAKDSGMNVVFAGHYATETLGVTALAKLLQQQFGVEIVFIDAPTGI